jgi:creatinine amidohydrolase/Fe(II)-dependent formamide hydrolase-like protein
MVAGKHAGVHDTSEVMYLDKNHTWIREDKLAPGNEKSGVDGDPRQASAELGEKFLDIKSVML